MLDRKYLQYKLNLQDLKYAEGSVVLEVVIVIAIVLAVALIFNDEIKSFADQLFSRAFNISEFDRVFTD